MPTSRIRARRILSSASSLDRNGGCTRSTVEIGTRRDQRAFCNLALKAITPRTEGVFRREAIHGHEADVVAIAGVFRAGVSKAHDEQHQSRPARKTFEVGSAGAHIGAPASGPYFFFGAAKKLIACRSIGAISSLAQSGMGMVSQWR